MSNNLLQLILRSRPSFLPAKPLDPAGHRPDATDPDRPSAGRDDLRGEERVDVVARAAFDRLEDLTVVAHDGLAVPVRQIARVDGADENPIIWRRDRQVVMIAQGDVAPDAQAPDVSNALGSKIGSVRASPPPSYRVEMGGTIEELQKGNSSIYALFPLMAVAMLTFLMLRLEGFSRLAIVFPTAPLDVIGASIALNLAHKPFGFVALLGLISLAAMACATASFWSTRSRPTCATGAQADARQSSSRRCAGSGRWRSPPPRPSWRSPPRRLSWR